MPMTPPEMTPEGTQPPRKPGMSTAAKVLIVLGVAFGIMVLLCCGSLIWFDWFWRCVFRDLQILR